MTPNDRQVTLEIIERLRATPVGDKDRELERLIRDSLSEDVDFLYKLLQLSIEDQKALSATRARINQLEAQIRVESKRGANSGIASSGSLAPDEPIGWITPASYVSLGAQGNAAAPTSGRDGSTSDAVGFRVRERQRRLPNNVDPASVPQQRAIEANWPDPRQPRKPH